MATTATKETDKAAGRVLLPSHLIPVRYHLTIEPDLDAFTFTGLIDIEFKVDSAKIKEGNNAAELTLHAKELAFNSAEYRINDAKPVPANEIHLNVPATTVKFIFAQPIEESTESVVVSIQYSGFINNQMAGFYRSSYQDIHGTKKTMASTQFESLDARRAFPCIDEPGVKAVFAITLIVPTDLVCFSNMPEASVVSLPNKKKKVSFLDSPIMSSYLVAFCLGEFDFLQATGPNGVLIRVYTPPGKSSHGTFALTAACRALAAYNDFFQLPYCLPKLDMVGIPEFAMGAMENWGLVTYREADLLIDPVKASSQQKQRVAVVVNHELAHQWFGNLVTMQWWDDLWLNEGFAAWAEHWATDQQFPNYKMWEQFTTGHLATGMRADALRSSHPIQVPIQHAEEVEQVFDAISYCKGASVVRMVRAVIGAKHFQQGLSDYMKKYAYSNTETYNLWSAWEQVSEMPVGEMMKSWTEQMGCPLVRVTKEDWQNDKVTLELDQMWFLADGSPLDDEEAAKKWTIPILAGTEAGTNADMTIMREKTATVTVETSSWVKLNVGQEVPMRVLPGEEMLKRLAAGVQTKSLAPIDRAGLLNDTYALVKAGHMPPESLIHLMASYKDEDNYIVWEGLSSVLGGLDLILSNDDTLSGYFRTFAKDFVLPLLEKVGWDAKETDEHLTTLLRNTMVNLLCTFNYNDPEVSNEARSRFATLEEDSDNTKSLPSDLKSPVFKIYLKSGGAKEYQDMLAYFRKATDDAERRFVFSAIGHTPDPKLKRAAMEWGLSGEVKTQDIIWPLGSVGSSSKEGREISWAFFQENFDRLKGIFGKASPSLMSHLIVMCAGGFCSHAKADEVQAFFEKNPLPSSSRKISQSLENMRANAKLLQTIQSSELSKAEFWEALQTSSTKETK